MNEPFPCTSCGLCCRHIGHIAELQHVDRGDGTCKHLVDGKCEIYDQRPLVCRVDEMYERFFIETLSKDEYWDMNLQACLDLQKAYHLPEDQQVQLRSKENLADAKPLAKK